MRVTVLSKFKMLYQNGTKPKFEINLTCHNPCILICYILCLFQNMYMYEILCSFISLYLNAVLSLSNKIVGGANVQVPQVHYKHIQLANPGHNLLTYCNRASEGAITHQWCWKTTDFLKLCEFVYFWNMWWIIWINQFILREETTL